MKTTILYVALAFLMIACHPKTEAELELDTEMNIMNCSLAPATDASEPSMNTMVKFVPPVIKKDDAIEAEPKTSTTKSTKSKKIIKDGSIVIKVKDIEAAKKHIDAVIKKYDSYYESEEFQNYDNKTRYILKIRIPSKQFENFLGAAENGEGQITSKTINARDVTEEYVDGEIRLNSKRLFRNRYNELLTKAGKVVDILAIEENIRVLQEEIESTEGRLKFLDDQVLYSTIDLTLLTEKEINKDEEKTETFKEKIKWSLATGWASVVTLTLWCIQQ